jgi:hypothetical protein
VKGRSQEECESTRRHLQDRGKQGTKREGREGIAKHHLTVPFSMPWVAYHPLSSKTHTASSTRNWQGLYHLEAWSYWEEEGRKEGQFLTWRGLVEKHERLGGEGGKVSMFITRWAGTISQPCGFLSMISWVCVCRDGIYVRDS